MRGAAAARSRQDAGVSGFSVGVADGRISPPHPKPVSPRGDGFSLDCVVKTPTPHSLSCDFLSWNWTVSLMCRTGKEKGEGRKSRGKHDHLDAQNLGWLLVCDGLFPFKGNLLCCCSASLICFFLPHVCISSSDSPPLSRLADCFSGLFNQSHQVINQTQAPTLTTGSRET